MEVLLALLKENPEGIPAVVKEYIGTYKPVVYDVLKELPEIYKDYVNNDEVHKLSAQAAKKKFDSFVEVGFTDDQAFTLLLNSNVALNESLRSMGNNSKKSSR